jgi:hypothetical protein
MRETVMRSQSVITGTLVLALLLVGSLLTQALWHNYRLPGNNIGYEPIQPIAYSHRLHAGELGVDCQHCHTGASRSPTAGIPPSSTCMNCHRFVSAPINVIRAEDEAAVKEQRPPRRIVSREIAKVYAAMGLNDEPTPDPTRDARPIEWTKVHSLPDYVSFDHSAHVNSGVECQTCHGEVQTMERVRQVSDLSMGWCVNCHRDANAHGIKGKKVQAPTDCIACHH